MCLMNMLYILNLKLLHYHFAVSYVSLQRIYFRINNVRLFTDINSINMGKQKFSYVPKNIRKNNIALFILCNRNIPNVT